MSKCIGVGVDVGGSHMSCVAIDIVNGDIQENTFNDLYYDATISASDFLSGLTNIINQSIQDAQGMLTQIGVAFPGPFDYEKGICKILGLNKLGNLFGLHIKSYLQNELNISDKVNISFVNDAEAFAIAENWIGKGKDHKHVLAITLGTGFGSTFIQNDQVVKSGEGIPVDGFLYSQPFEDQMADDCFSTRWFVKRWKELCGESIEGVKDIYEYAKQNDEKALALFEEFGRQLARFLVPYLRDSETEALVVGGSISKSISFFKSSLQTVLSEASLNVAIEQADSNLPTGHIGAVKAKSLIGGLEHTTRRSSSQLLLPAQKEHSDIGSYDIHPGHEISQGALSKGYTGLADWISQHKTVVIETYIGVFKDDLRNELNKCFRDKGLKVQWYDAEAALKPADAIEELINPYLGGDDPIFGTRCNLDLSHFFNINELKAIKPDTVADINILIGTGASLCKWQGPLIYIDLPKNELQFRMRAGSILNLGADSLKPAKTMYKRFYFVDWPVLNQVKQKLLNRIDILVDDQRELDPVWVKGETVRKALHEMSQNFFRVRPWFEPGVWGGSWMKENIKGLAQDVPNYAWSFELIVPENGLLLQDQDRLLELSFDFLMYANHENVLGEAARRFHYEFPIRFDYLDTFDGGNLSVQCHPAEDYIKTEFGETFTQDECYYILDAKEDAKVYLGFQDNIKEDEFRKELQDSYENNREVNIPDYVQVHDSKKHDLFLIPNQTIHGSGVNNLVLEISSTPYIFTFKLYDWLRLDLDGNPRPININRGFKNLDFTRKGKVVQEQLISKPALIDSGADWKQFHLPTHAEHFYDVHRYEFENRLEIKTDNQCHVLMLVEGTSLLLKTKHGKEQRFNYAETFVVPAAAESYTLINEGKGKAMLVKAFVKSEKV